MKITLTDGNNFVNLDVDEEQPIEDVKALLEAETGTPMHRIELYYDSAVLKDSEKLSARGIKEGALLYFVIGAEKPKTVAKPKKGLGIANMIKNFDKQIKSVREEGYEFNHRRVEEFRKEAERLISEMADDPVRLQEVAANHPQIADAIAKRDADALARLMHARNEEKIKELKEKERLFLELSKDPMNPEYQRMLEERIAQENIDKNLEFANEYIP